MPQAVQPGSYSSAYAQQLQKDVMTMAANPSMTLSMLTPNPMMTQADALIGNSVSSIDTMMAMVGVSANPGANMTPTGTAGLTSPLGGAASPLIGALGGSGLSGAGTSNAMLGGAGNAGLSGDVDTTMQPSNMMSMAMPMLERLMTLLMSLGGGSPQPVEQPAQATVPSGGGQFDISRSNNSPFMHPANQFSTFA